MLEYCLAVPANRLGYGTFSGFQLKIIQEIVTLIVFMVFAITFLKEKVAWNYLVAFGFLGGATRGTSTTWKRILRPGKLALI